MSTAEVATECTLKDQDHSVADGQVRNYGYPRELENSQTPDRGRHRRSSGQR